MHSETFFDEVVEIAQSIDAAGVENLATELAALRQRGGSVEKNVSANIVAGLKEAKQRSMKIFGVVGRDGGYTKQVGDCVVVVPTVEASRVTPHTEAFQAVVWHCLVSHPKLQQVSTKW